MAEGENKMRLSKIALELNIRIVTIFDFLEKQGIDIKKNPNAKISTKIHQILLNEFQEEKAIKEESKLLGLDKQERETITLEKTTAISDSEKKKKLDDVFVENIQETIPYEPQHHPVKTSSQKDPLTGVKIVGKIEVKQEKTTGRKGKKFKETQIKEKPAPGKKLKSSEPDSIGIEDAETIKKDRKSSQPEIFESKSEKLEGPKVVGAIDLPVAKDPKKRLVASSSDNIRVKKKKRKRIKNKEYGKEKIKAFDGRAPHGSSKGGKLLPSEEDIQKQIKETLSRLSITSKSKSSKYRKLKREAVSEAKEKKLEQDEEEKKTIMVTEFVSANELSKMINVPVNDIISSCMELGLFVSINQRLNAETLSIVAEEFGYKVKFVSVDLQQDIQEEEDKPEDLKDRPPIVTVMGHVDHGKTSLLDFIRKSNIIAGEAGGITQHIGAYVVTLDNKKNITFLDTPGHEAFTAMRARGAQVTDVAIIVIAADDGIMPQTIEAINHAHAANVPIVIAINKIDKPGANSDKIKEELSKMNILVEDWGGKYQCQEISAKFGTNVEVLLEKVILEAELLELKANPDKRASGTVIESSLDKGKGYLSTLLVANGTLKNGDILVAGCFNGKIKAMFNERGSKIAFSGPATPVVVLGLNGAPQSGDKFNILDDEREAKDISAKRMQLQREQGVRTHKHITLDEIGRRIAIGDFKELNVIVKGDVDGSIEALSDAMLKLSSEQIQVNIIHKSVGQIIESDVLLASASNAIIIGFQVRPSAGARKLAEQEQIDIRLYSIIYDAINEVKSAMEGMLTPSIEEKIVCNVEVRDVFKITKVGAIAGCMVLDGKITRNTKVRIIRDGIVVYTGGLGSLKRFKEDVKEVASGYECGLNIQNFNDVKIGDAIEGYEEFEVRKKLQV